MDNVPDPRVPLPSDTTPDEPLEIVFVEDLQPARGSKARPRPVSRRRARKAKPPAAGKQLARPRKAGSGERGRGKKANH